MIHRLPAVNLMQCDSDTCTCESNANVNQRLPFCVSNASDADTSICDGNGNAMKILPFVNLIKCDIQRLQHSFRDVVSLITRASEYGHQE